MHDVTGEVVPNSGRRSTSRRSKLLERYERFLHHAPFYENSACVALRWITKLSLTELVSEGLVDADNLRLLVINVGTSVEQAEALAEHVSMAVDGLGEIEDVRIVVRSTGPQSRNAIVRFVQVFNGLSDQHLWPAGTTLCYANARATTYRESCRDYCDLGLTVFLRADNSADILRSVGFEKGAIPYSTNGGGFIWCDVTDDQQVSRHAFAIRSTVSKRGGHDGHASCGLILSSGYRMLDSIIRLGIKSPYICFRSMDNCEELISKRVARMNSPRAIVSWMGDGTVEATDFGKVLFDISDRSTLAIGIGEAMQSSDYRWDQSCELLSTSHSDWFNGSELSSLNLETNRSI